MQLAAMQFCANPASTDQVLLQHSYLLSHGHVTLANQRHSLMLARTDQDIQTHTTKYIHSPNPKP